MKYPTIVADPPWPIRWSGGTTRAGETSGSVRRYTKKAMPYPTMTIDAIASLPVSPLAANDAHLFLWTLDRYVLDGSAARVCRAWGFEPLDQMLVWSKASAGLGRHIRPSHELVVIGRRGGARFAEVSTTSVRAWRQVYEAGSKVHSAKPDAAYDEIEAISCGPYLELFARRQRLGWDSWGNEARCDVAIASAKEAQP